MSSAEKGLVVALPILSGSLLRIPVGLLSDRFGAKRIGVALLAFLFLGNRKNKNPYLRSSDGTGEQRALGEREIMGHRTQLLSILLSAGNNRPLGWYQGPDFMPEKWSQRGDSNP